MKTQTHLTVTALLSLLAGPATAQVITTPIYVLPPQLQTPAVTPVVIATPPATITIPGSATPAVMPTTLPVLASPVVTPTTPAPLVPVTPLPSIVTSPSVVPPSVTTPTIIPATVVPATVVMPEQTLPPLQAAPAPALSGAETTAPGNAGLSFHSVPAIQETRVITVTPAVSPERLLAWFGVGLMTSNKGLSAGLSYPVWQQPSFRVALRGLGEYGLKPGNDVVVPVLAARADLLGEWKLGQGTVYGGPGIGLHSDKTKLVGLSAGYRLPLNQGQLGAFVEGGINAVAPASAQVRTELSVRGGLTWRFY